MDPFVPFPRLLPTLSALAAPATVRVLASYHPIGFTDKDRVTIDVSGPVTTAVYGDMPTDALLADVPSFLATHSEPSDPIFVAFYFGSSGFLSMSTLLASIRRIRPNTRAAALVCDCASPDHAAILRHLLANRTVDAVGRCSCGGSREMHAIRLALTGHPTDEAIRLTPGLGASRALSPDA